MKEHHLTYAPGKAITHKITPIKGMPNVEATITAIHFFLTYPRSSNSNEPPPSKEKQVIHSQFNQRQDSLQFELQYVHLPRYPLYFLQNLIIVPFPQFSQGPRDSSGMSMNPFSYFVCCEFLIISHHPQTSFSNQHYFACITHIFLQHININ